MVAFGIENGHMWMTFAVILGAIILFAQDRIPIELSAMGIVTALLLLFYFYPLEVAPGSGIPLGATELLAGFANPVLFAILALLMIGQGLFQTGAVEKPAQLIGGLAVLGPTLALGAGLLVAASLSAFLNNTPVVVIFIPILVALAARLKLSSARVLMPLSFITILGGMTTLIGSSSNLVATAVAEANGAPRVGFFDFAVPRPIPGRDRRPLCDLGRAPLDPALPDHGRAHVRSERKAIHCADHPDAGAPLDRH